MCYDRHVKIMTKNLHNNEFIKENHQRINI